MMPPAARCTLVRIWLVCVVSHSLCATTFATDFDTLIQSSCIECHDANTETRLDFTTLGKDFENAESFRKWVHVFDRVKSGDMPPPEENQPSDAARIKALSYLENELKRASRRSQETIGRVPSRRLSRLEYEHTLHDLLGIGGDLARHLPPENESGAFDVIAATQDMSSVHVRGLLMAADLALDEAIQLGASPEMAEREIDYFNSRYIQMWVDRPVRRGGGTIFKTDRDVVTFRGENYVFRSDANGFRPPVAGRYRITVKAAAYQPRSAITVSLKRQNDEQGQSELFAAWDLVGSDYREVSTITYLRPDDYIYISADELEPARDGRVIYNSQPASTFGGEGVTIRRVAVEGPLETTWPPERTRKLFPGIEWKASSESRQGFRYEPVLTKPPLEHVRAIVSAIAPRAWRRQLSHHEIDALTALAKPSLDAKRDFVESARMALRAILVSPQLLFQTGEAGPLEDEALASRLSYFLWRSLPDDELVKLAAENRLSDPQTLAAQVDRMLADPKRDRFVHEFPGQWLELDRIDATTPDAWLYPEYDDVLRKAMLAETREFFAHLIDRNLSVVNLVDSEFTFLNRRLAEHYGIVGVEGEAMRKVRLDPASVRGGILGHASIAKVTANGTVTTPVKRGNFVLTNLLGLPPNPPPPGVGAIEPDTRGATTIRETLEKHQSVDACAVCHRTIDPPGFALECFDPVGNFRERYRNSKGVNRETNIGLRFLHKDYTLGQPVDMSGVTADGFEFDDIRDFKTHLRESKEQIARNILFKLIAFSTGAEVQFADRDEVERILQATQDKEYPLRSLIHHVVASRVFTNR
jgi:Protein of unknown function (DUF1592)/Protein of unknown function (DUF1588)/Protein of unknown function (DUF1587)/Protein of unknown function (DUF1585)/Protein of unknown function (DUF1595)